MQLAAAAIIQTTMIRSQARASVASDQALESRAALPIRAMFLVLAAILIQWGLAADAAAEPVQPQTPTLEIDAPEPPLLRPLSDLLVIPRPDYVWHGATTDAEIAAAVRLGNDPDLEPLNPFRKRKVDLFKSEHPLEIGNAEMLLRFRLRPKARETMSVELKF